LVSIITPKAIAEGSKELTSGGGNRSYLTYTNSGTYFGIPEKTVVNVFVNSGEILHLGSSANNIGSGRINYTKPNGTTGSCTASNTVGRITDRSQEQNGPFPASGGYTPCTLTVGSGEGGIWKIDFVSPNPNMTAPLPGAPPVIGAGSPWFAQGTGDWFVTAWDVTVTASGTIKSGRAYVDYLAMNIGTNTSNAFNALLYVVTKDGYHYQVDTNGLDPFRFVFFSDNKGIFNSSTSNPSYRSADLSGSSLPSGLSFRNPGTSAETSTSYNNKIFFNPIDSTLPSTATKSGGFTWLNPSLANPLPPLSFDFKGSEGTSGQAGASLGGTFTFTNPNTTAVPYQVIIDLNNNGILGDGNDRTLIGTATTGNNTIIWNGKDGNGQAVPPSSTNYKGAAAFLGGEVHFPLIDAESNTSGFIFTRLNGAFGNPILNSPTYGANYIYYDDSQMIGNGGSGGGSAVPPTPRSALQGLSSAAGAHRWGTSSGAGFGNASLIDTWAYAPTFVDSTLNINVKAADLRITKTRGSGTVVAGGIATYTIDVTNFNNPSINSINDVNGVTVTDVLQSILSNPSVVSCEAITGTGSCSTASFSGNTLNATLDLSSGATIRLVIQATVSSSAAGTTLTNTATVNRSPDVADPVDQDGLGGSTNLSESATDTTTVASSVAVSGKVWQDSDGSAAGTFSNINTGVETGVNLNSLYAILVDASNNVIASSLLVSGGTNVTNGTYTFNVAPNQTNVKVLLSTVAGSIGNPAPAASLPAEWINTSPLTSASFNISSGNVTGIDFGIEQLPDTMDLTPTSQTNPGGTNQVQIPTLTGTDPEDGSLGSGESFKVVSLPTNGTLYYDGITITTPNFVIANYDPTKLTVDPDDGAITVSFTYAAIDAAGKEDPTPATVSIPFTAALNNPNILLVKRITQINRNTASVGGDDLASYTDTNSPYDDNVDQTPPFLGQPNPNQDDTTNWPDPSLFLIGGVNGGQTRPGDEIEYTIYFLSTGQGNAINVKLCDRIPENQTFVPTAFNTTPPAPGGLPTSDRGIVVNLGGTVQAYTNDDDGDIVRYFPPNSDPTTVYPTLNCGGANTNGAVVVNLGTLPSATAPGTPANSYGYIRFRATVN
jgi:uncharacterized repeat protein (TIGR01451 family)